MAKKKITDEFIEEAAGYIAFGMTAQDTYTVLGVSKSSWFGWLKKGKEAAEAGWPKRWAIYRKFYETIEKAKLKRKITYLQRIDNATDKDWRAAAWLLEKLYPDEFAKRAIEAKVKHSGAVGSVEVSLSDIPEEEREQLVMEAIKAIKIEELDDNKEGKKDAA